MIKKWSQSSAFSFEYLLANHKRAFLCFSLNRDNFFLLKAFHPFLVMYLHTVMLETSIFFLLKILGNFRLFNCFVCTSLSRLIFKNNWSKQVWSSASYFVFEALSFRPLVHQCFVLLKNEMTDFFD